MGRMGKKEIGGGMATDWNAITEAAARQLKGEPNSRLSNRREFAVGEPRQLQADRSRSGHGDLVRLGGP